MKRLLLVTAAGAGLLFGFSVVHAVFEAMDADWEVVCE